MRRALVLVPFSAAAVAALLLAHPRVAPAAPKPYRVVEVKDGGSIRGLCKINADVTMPKVKVEKDNDKGCGDKERDTERLIVSGERGVANCFVGIKKIEAGKDWPASMKSDDRVATIDQKGCKYAPHIQWTRIDTQVVVLNSDQAEHNIHAYRGSLADTQFNFTSAPGQKVDDVAAALLEQPANYIVKCDIHPWMSAFVWVVDHPYWEITPAEPSERCKAGEFLIESVPPGDYELVMWHEGMVETPTVIDGQIKAYAYSKDVEQAKPVKVEAGKTAIVDFEIEAPKK
jgi:hypothetical protein